MSAEWELVTSEPVGIITERLRVPGGWLYRCLAIGPDGSPALISCVYVDVIAESL